MDYFKQLRAFRIRLKISQLTSPAIALWYALASIANDIGQTDGLTVAISTLATEAGTSRDGVLRARNVLQQKGFIKWQERRGRQSASYSLNDLTIDFASQTTTQSASQTATHSTPQTTAQTAPIYNYTKPNETKPSIKKTHYNNGFKYSARAACATAQNILDQLTELKPDGYDGAIDDLCGYFALGMTPEQAVDALADCKCTSYIPAHLHSYAVYLGIEEDDA